MKSEELFIPEFILGEIPIKDGSLHDQRMFIYCPRAISLIEAVAELETDTVLNHDIKQKRYYYVNADGIKEKYTLGIVQNNCELVDVDPVTLLDNAWRFFESYLAWEDSNLDEEELGSMN